ncbi:Bug family tripartite tricarboxylate transporter substrate binding protein [Sulfurospirillum arcachonense]|uniref:Bug family tripartite tricarboxylate transporter substrate binding protein n=1 Tax=Sulfurospirillum arcachonense TaxID=57666 RepID=UPI0004692720|nr:tripartite tricarboxylate transporter substrate binding protein [Sulfurospirillum arcachonense]
MKKTDLLRKSAKILGGAALACGMLVSSSLAADKFPTKPINLVVGFGIGGSADRMSRSMSSFLSDTLDERVKVINKKGAGTQIAANYVLRKPADGYTVFASTFTPYLANTILTGGAKYKIEDFDYMNIQWYDYDLIAVNSKTPYKSLKEILETIKNEPKKIKAAVLQGSGGHLLLKMLLEKHGIPSENLNLVTYQSGGKARAAVAGGQVDLIAISAEGSESIREFLTPLAIFKEERHPKWDVPTVNEAVKELGYQLPFFNGSMRGFAVSAKMKKEHPARYATLVDAIKKTLAKKDVQKFLKKSKIGGTWTGPEKSNAILKESFAVYKKYGYLLKK